MVLEVNESRITQEKSKKAVFDNLRRKSIFYLNKPVLEDLDLYYFVKDFFKEYLNLDKELSFQEIIQEIEKTYIPRQTKNNLINYLNKIEVIEFKDSSFNEEELKTNVKEFYTIVKTLPFDEVITLSFFDKVKKALGLKTKEEELTTTNQTPVSVVEEIKIEPVIEEVALEPEIVEENNVKEQIDETQKILNEEQKTKKLPEHLDKIELSDDFTQDITLSTKKEEIPWLENLDEPSPDLNQTMEFSEEIKLQREETKKDENINETKNTKKQEKTQKKKQTTQKKNKQQKKETTKQEPKDFFKELKKTKNLKNKEKLKEKYKELHQIYETLNMQEKTKAYPELLKLYEKITKL